MPSQLPPPLQTMHGVGVMIGVYCIIVYMFGACTGDLLGQPITYTRECRFYRFPWDFHRLSYALSTALGELSLMEACRKNFIVSDFYGRA